MWIAFRLILAIVGFVVRQVARGKKTATDGYFEGIAYFQKVRETKKKGVTGFTIGMERRSPTWLRCHAESSVDRFFKKLGVANEVRTGDEQFDDLVYVTCDHPYIQALLTETQELRDAIAEALNSGYKRVVFNGSTVAIERDADHRPMQRDFEVLKAIHTASARLEDELPSRFADPFLWKALIVEGVIWSIVGYAVGAAIEMAFTDADVHVARTALVKLGLMVAGAVFVVLLAIIVLWMRGSSRGHRVIVEGAILLLLALPVSGIQLVGDTNRGLDDAPPIVVNRTYNQCEVREHHRRSRRSWRRRTTTYTYHLWLDPVAAPSEADPADGPLPPRLPQTIEITRELCDAITPDKTVEITLGPGRWGLVWYRRITIGDTTWSP